MERLTEEQQRLAEEAVTRAESIAKRYARIFPEHEDDFKSSANFGAVRAAASFKPELGGVWERWSGLHIRGEIQDFLNGVGRRVKSEDVSEFIDMLEDRRQVGTDGADAYEWAMAVLPKEYRKVCSLVYRDGMTPDDAGVALGFTGRHGRRIHGKAIQKLRKLVAD